MFWPVLGGPPENCRTILQVAGCIVETFDLFVDMAFYIPLYGSDNLFGVTLLCLREAKVLDDGNSFT